MKLNNPYHLTGIFGIIIYVLVLLEISLYFIYTPTASNTPPNEIIIARILVDMFVCVGLIGFFSGLGNIVSQSTPSYGWLGSFILSCGVAFSVLVLVADSIQIGSVWAAGPNVIDPTWVGSGGEGTLLIYGPINRLLTMAILLAGSTLILKTRLCPKWIAWLGHSIAVCQLCFVMTIFHMTTPMDFYSVNGWNIPIAAGLFFLWVLLVSVALLRKKIILEPKKKLERTQL